MGGRSPSIGAPKPSTPGRVRWGCEKVNYRRIPVNVHETNHAKTRRRLFQRSGSSSRRRVVSGVRSNHHLARNPNCELTSFLDATARPNR